MTTKNGWKILCICAWKRAATLRSTASRKASFESNPQQMLQSRASAVLRRIWESRALQALLIVLPIAVLTGCAGLVSGSSSSTSGTLAVSNVQTSAITTSSSQVNWTTDVLADSSVDYGTTPSFGNTTPVNSVMVSSHQVPLSGLAAGTTYYYQVNSTDVKGNHGHGGNSFKTLGVSVSGTINPTSDGSGATVTLSGTQNATATADNSGAYTFSDLPSGSYTVKPNKAGYSFSPASQTVTVGTANVAGVNFAASTSTSAPTISTQPVNQTVTAGQTATFSVVAAGTAPLSYQWQKNGVNIAGATGASYTTPVTATTDSGSTFDVVVSNTAGTITSNAATLTVNAPAIQLGSTSINFGNEVVNVATSQALIIKNTGTATLSIAQINPTGSAFSVSGFTLPLNITTGNQTTISVGFLPTATGAVSGSLSIVSNAPTSPTAVTLSGMGIAATLTLSISPTSLSFGNVTTNTSSAAQDVTITNTGNANVTISQITLNGAAYSITGGSAPVTLTPNQNIVLAVQFNPTATGTVNGSISISSNAAGSPATVTLTGTGVAPAQHSVVLTWTASTSTVAGYNVYRGTTSGGPYTKINSSLITTLAYTDSTVQNGTTYYYVATAVDSSGGESVNSKEVSAVIP